MLTQFPHCAARYRSRLLARRGRRRSYRLRTVSPASPPFGVRVTRLTAPSFSSPLPDADIVATKARSFVSMDDASTSGGLAQAKGRGPLFIQEKLDREVAQQKMGSTMWFI